jgi:glutathione S-transferase
MMRLYDYAASANCFKVRLLLSLLGREYERVPVDIFAGETLTPEYALLNPARETPVLQVDSGEIVTQSNAILWYLAEGTPFLADDPLSRAHVVQWLSFEQERVMSGIGSARFWTLTGRNPSGIPARFALGEATLAILDAHLESRDWLVGDRCTIADVSVFGYTHAAPDAGFDLDRHPSVAGWLDRIAGLPGYMNDFIRYPDNARPGRSRSIYD